MIRFPMGNCSGLGDDATLAARKAYYRKGSGRGEIKRYWFPRRRRDEGGESVQRLLGEAIFETRCTIALLGKEAA